MRKADFNSRKLKTAYYNRTNSSNLNQQKLTEM